MISNVVYGLVKTSIFEHGYTAIVEDIVWIKTTEVSNHEYRSFVDSQELNISSLLPDSTNWELSGAFMEPFTKHYFRHPAYDDYPVVNISHQQTRLFCEWLTKQFNAKLRAEKQSPYNKIRVRLPTVSEWKNTARLDTNPWSAYPWNGHSLREPTGAQKGKFRCNFVRSKGDYSGIPGALNDGAFITAPVKSYSPTASGIYNLAGNVAEMVDKPCIALGGGWRSRADELQINASPIKYGPTGAMDVGFRYVIEVVEWSIKPKRKLTITAKAIEESIYRIDTNLLMGTEEVSNHWYSTYARQSETSMPNGSIWSDVIPYSQKLESLYFKDNRYKSYPVTGVSQEEANEFCVWLTTIYNQEKKRKYEEVVIRLPSPKEWMDMRDKLYHQVKTNTKQRTLVDNFNCLGQLDSTLRFHNSMNDQPRNKELDGFIATAPNRKFKVGNFYGFFANAAEWTNKKDTAIGNSFLDSKEMLFDNPLKKVKSSNAHTGFRYVVEIIKN